jgi:DNA-binding transcriptional regulator YdaS (Cro superfamily)
MEGKLKLTPDDIIDAAGGTTEAALLSLSAKSTVSEWRKLREIPFGKLVLLAYPIERKTNGKINRKKLFPTIWPQIWPELMRKAK